MGHRDVVMVASMLRAGSTWTFNVVRGIAARGGLTPLPALYPNNDPTAPEYADIALADDDPTHLWVFKSHQCMDPGIPGIRYLVPYRDPRDAVISWMRFEDRSFEEGMDFVRQSMEICEHYRAMLAARRQFVRYDRILSDPCLVIREISTFIGITLAEADPETIRDENSKDKVKTLIARKEAALVEKAKRRDPVHPKEITQTKTGRVRAMDDVTGYQSGHVSDYREGGWKDMLTDAQQARLNALCRDWYADFRADVS